MGSPVLLRLILSEQAQPDLLYERLSQLAFVDSHDRASLRGAVRRGVGRTSQVRASTALTVHGTNWHDDSSRPVFTLVQFNGAQTIIVASGVRRNGRQALPSARVH